MPGLIPEIPFLLAQQANRPPAPGNGGGGFSPITMVPAILLLFYLIVWRPKQQEEQKRKDLLGGLKKNDRVLTLAGIYGTVVSVNNEADRVVVRVDDERGVKLEFSRSSIARVIEPPGEKGAEVAEGAKAR